MSKVNFNTKGKEEVRLIARIAARAVQLAVDHDAHYDFMTANMDVTACHCNGMPLKLTELLAADDSNFSHDVSGIRRHIDRETGKIGDHFVPRYAAPVVA